MGGLFRRAGERAHAERLMFLGLFFSYFTDYDGDIIRAAGADSQVH